MLPGSANGLGLATGWVGGKQCSSGDFVQPWGTPSVLARRDFAA